MAEPSPNGWLQLTVSVPQGRCEAVSEALLAMGATGLQEDHPGLHFDDGDGPLVAEGWNLAEAANPTDEIDLRAWFPGEEDADELARWLKRETGPRPTVERIADQDWNSTWKRSWSPGPLCRRILVVPSWETEFQLAEGQIALRMDPGLAFGTGTHPTTRCCAAFLEELLEAGRVETVLDVGTGTGVLATAALLLGARSATGVDTDPHAIEAAADNAARNGTADRLELRIGSVEAAAGRYDLVFANLLAPLLIELAEPLTATVAPGGSLVASGLLVGQADEVIDALEGAGLRLVERRDGPAWSTLRLELR
jgi:ribosomal protein L11 methyltransferase